MKLPYKGWETLKLVDTDPLRVIVDTKLYTALRDHRDSSYRLGTSAPHVEFSFETDLPVGLLPDRARLTTFIQDNIVHRSQPGRPSFSEEISP